MNHDSSGFKNDFIFGVATSSLQIEGSLDADGRGPSIWDERFLKEGEGVNSYLRLQEDIEALKKLGVKAYRFSISWTRLFPKGIGEKNPLGFTYYDALVDHLLKNGITPFVTLFHWDYPLCLENRGGWLHKDSPLWFQQYASEVAKHFKGRVKNYITINEPECFVELGYKVGVMAPFKKLDRKTVLMIGENVMKASALAFDAIKNVDPLAKVSFAGTYTPAYPFDKSNPQDIEAARRCNFSPFGRDDLFNISYWADPMLLGEFNQEWLKAYGCSYVPHCEAQIDIKRDYDFLSLNLYHGYQVRAGEKGPLWVEKKGVNKNSLGWEIHPEALYYGPLFCYERYHKSILISENGTCYEDRLIEGKIPDQFRIEYLHDYLINLKRVSYEIPVVGYFYWSLIDNFEWSNGYSPRFGLIYCDYEREGKRIEKDSFSYFSKIIATNGRLLEERHK